MVQLLLSRLLSRERQTVIPRKHPSIVKKIWKRGSNGVKAWFSLATQAQAQAQERLFHRENELDACASSSSRIHIFPCACAYACVLCLGLRYKKIMQYFY